MHDKDTVTKIYMKDNAIFADPFNYYVYSGRPVIKPEDLTELDSTESAAIFTSGNSKDKKPDASVQRIRDVLKYAVIKLLLCYTLE